jgi:hypothetical protein
MEGISFSLQDAFIHVVYDPDHYKKQDKKGKDRIRNYRRFYKQNQITQDKMVEIIADYGFKKLQESLWTLGNGKS